MVHTNRVLQKGVTLIVFVMVVAMVLVGCRLGSKTYGTKGNENGNKASLQKITTYTLQELQQEATDLKRLKDPKHPLRIGLVTVGEKRPLDLFTKAQIYERVSHILNDRLGVSVHFFIARHFALEEYFHSLTSKQRENGQSGLRGEVVSFRKMRRDIPLVKMLKACMPSSYSQEAKGMQSAELVQRIRHQATELIKLKSYQKAEKEQTLYQWNSASWGTVFVKLFPKLKQTYKERLYLVVTSLPLLETDPFSFAQNPFALKPRGSFFSVYPYLTFAEKKERVLRENIASEEVRALIMARAVAQYLQILSPPIPEEGQHCLAHFTPLEDDFSLKHFRKGECSQEKEYVALYRDLIDAKRDLLSGKFSSADAVTGKYRDWEPKLKGRIGISYQILKLVSSVRKGKGKSFLRDPIRYIQPCDDVSKGFLVPFLERLPIAQREAILQESDKYCQSWKEKHPYCQGNVDMVESKGEK